MKRIRQSERGGALQVVLIVLGVIVLIVALVVLAAAALRCLNGEMQGRLVADKPEHRERLAKMGIKDPKRIYSTRDLAPGKNIVFACTGVTNGDLLRGVRFFGEGDRTHSLVMTLEPHNVRFVDAVHLERQDDFKVRFS